jgi:hypothetical protein
MVIIIPGRTTFERLHLSNIIINVDGSPSGYTAWYNHFTGNSRIRTVSPAVKKDKFDVKRIEMLAIYFALVDHRLHFKTMSKNTKKKQQGPEQLIIDIRSDSKSTVEQLKACQKSEIKCYMEFAER